MPTEPEDTNLSDFIQRYRADRDAGLSHSVRHYLESFPGQDDAIAAAYVDLQRQIAAASEELGERLGPYRLDEEIGRGGQGVVFRATDTRVGRRVAVKVLKGLGPGSETLLGYFKREAAIASRLDHPGLCPVYDAEVQAGIPYIAMRFVEGETLAQRISATRMDAAGDVDLSTVMFDFEDDVETTVEHHEQPTSSGPTNRSDLMTAILMIEKAARALHAAHEAGVIHRDIKPGNIMVTPQGEVVVMDFGLARDDDSDLQSLTQPGDLVGTPAYMSPEQLTRQLVPLDRRTDVWSLGVMLYECVTLKRPFEEATRQGLYQSIMAKEPADPRALNPRLPRDLVTVIQTALQKDRNSRYQTALDLAEELRRVREFEPIQARPVSPWTRLVRWGQRNPALAAMTGAAALILVIGSVTAALLALQASDNAERAERSAERAQANLLEWERLADGRRLSDRLTEADGPLWPVSPLRLAAYRAWIEKAEALTAKLSDHERALHALRARGTYDAAADRTRTADERARLRAISNDLAQLEAALRATRTRRTELVEERAPLVKKERPAPLTAAESSALETLSQRIEAVDTSIANGERRRTELGRERVRLESITTTRSSWRFEDEGDQLRHDKLRDLVSQLNALQAEASPDTITIAAMRSRLAEAAEYARRLEEDDASAWQRCIDDLATPDERYTKPIRITPIAGLVPLGRDENSRLWEFWHMASGARPGWNAAEGRPFGRVSLDPKSGAEGIVLVLIPGGTTKIGAMRPDGTHPKGSPFVDEDSFPDEQNVHDVTLDPFFISKYEVTQGQWTRLFASNASTYQAGEQHQGEQMTLRMPMMNVNWNQCAEACRRWGLELPTESRWEFACRAGTSTRFWTGNEVSSLAGYENIGGAERERYYVGTFEMSFDDGLINCSPVGALKPNRFGLHDMHGNVGEWCLDGETDYPSPLPSRGDGLRTIDADARRRMLRGGSFDGIAIYARSANRIGVEPSARGDNAGFRTAMSLPAR